MSTKMTRVECPQCEAKFEIEGRLDDNMDVTTTCPECEWVTSAWNFYPSYKSDGNDKAYDELGHLRHSLHYEEKEDGEPKGDNDEV